MHIDTLGWALVAGLALLNTLEVRALRADLHDLAELRAEQVRK